MHKLVSMLTANEKAVVSVLKVVEVQAELENFDSGCSYVHYDTTVRVNSCYSIYSPRYFAVSFTPMSECLSC